MASLEGIYNFLPLTDSIATAGQPTAAELAAIQAAGYDAVINLLPAASPDALTGEEAIVLNLGLEYVHIPVEWTNPSAADTEHFFGVMAAYGSRRVFIHCAANMRVSAFLYLYRTVRQHVPRNDAIRDLHRIWSPSAVWQRFIDDFNPLKDNLNN